MVTVDARPKHQAPQCAHAHPGHGLGVGARGPVLVSACGEQQPTTANRGDCGPSIRFHGVVYINNTAVNQAAPKGRTIGRGTVLDCDLTTAVDTVVVSRVKGADRHQTISVRGRWHGVYVAKDLPHAGWPAVVRAK